MNIHTCIHIALIALLIDTCAAAQAVKKARETAQTGTIAAALRAGHDACIATISKDIALEVGSGAVGGVLAGELVDVVGSGAAHLAAEIHEPAEEIVEEFVDTVPLDEGPDAGLHAHASGDQKENSALAQSLSNAGVAQGSIVTLGQAVQTRPSDLEACYLAVEHSLGYTFDNRLYSGPRYAYLAVRNQTGQPLNVGLSDQGPWAVVPANRSVLYNLGGGYLKQVVFQQGSKQLVLPVGSLMIVGQVLSLTVQVARDGKKLQVQDRVGF